MNPLLDFSGLPPFDAIRAEHVSPAVDDLLAHGRATIRHVVAESQPASWDNLVEPLADALDRIDRAWSAVRHLNAVVSTAELRDAYNGNLPKVTAFYTDLARIRSFARYRAGCLKGIRVVDAAKKFIENELRDFRLGA
jgi:oligopeptidase A